MAISAQLRGFQELSPQQWLDRVSRTVPQALSLLLVLAIAWQLVQLTWLLLDRGNEPVPAPVAAAPLPASQPKGPNIQSIVDAHLFGQPQAKSEVDPSTAPQTQMNLVLSAVFATSDPTKGWAIIGESPTSAKVFMIGEAVRSGTKLHAVYPDRVILERDGQLEALALPTQSLAGMLSQPAAAPRPAGSQFTENLRRIAETNPTAFSEIVRPQPVFANGVQRGYRVYPGRNRQQFARLGLQPGDLVVSINGTPLDDPQRGMEIFNTMSSSDRVTVSVERNGQAQDLTLNTAQISLPESTPGQAPGVAPGPNRGIAPPPSPGADGPQVE
jgi:general secretion pathway protein C